MIFLGDIAHPYEQAPNWPSEVADWRDQVVVCNLEGPLVDESSGPIGMKVVFNHRSILESLRAVNVKAVSLANNHITDLPGGLRSTITQLNEVGITSFGAGPDRESAAAPSMIQEDGVEYILMGAGWQTVRCRPAHSGREGVNPLTPAHVLADISQASRRCPQGSIVLSVHWNYELEGYPQPAHRELAYAAIDAGAAAVIGHHPHRVAGLEVYKGAPIAYSLGNWWMPQCAFMAGTLSYPPESSLELALEWSPGKEPILHWYEYCLDEHSLAHVASEPLGTSARMRALTPFDGFDHDAYVSWFKEHRAKKLALPIYKSYRDTRLNRLKDGFVSVRHVGLTAIQPLRQTLGG